MANQHFMNSVQSLVPDALEGLLAANPNFVRLDGFPHTKVVYDSDRDKSKVAVVSGGGAGHEPAMAGFVGEGMLAGAVSGDVFASPSEDAVLALIRTVAGPEGVLVIVMNYTGDRLNFGSAVERARTEGIKADMVIVRDDVAPIEGGSVRNRRGIAGTVLVHKVAGAAAAEGKSLEQVTAAAEAACNAVVSMGCSLSTCNAPGAEPSDRIKAGTMEMGLGIHGEPGAYTTDVEPLDDIIAKLLRHLNDAKPISDGGEVVLLVNNLGGTTPLELLAATGSAVRLLGAEYGVTPARVITGPVMTSLAMHGLSLSLGFADACPDLVLAVDAGTSAPGWPGARLCRSLSGRVVSLPTGATDEAGAGAETGVVPDVVRAALTATAKALSACRRELDELDGKVGDGDCGSTLARGAEAVAAAAASGALASGGDDPGSLAVALGAVAGAAMGGTSGAVYKLVFTAAGGALKAGGGKGGPAPTAQAYGAALEAGADAASKYGGAERGDRTMLTSLWAAAAALKDGAGLAAAARAADKTAQATAAVEHAGAGRSAYVRGELLRGVPDPGAVGVAHWMTALVPVLTGDAAAAGSQ